MSKIIRSEVELVYTDAVYVPRYDPSVVYGSWWWPAYPPFAYYPVWPGVAVGRGSIRVLGWYKRGAFLGLGLGVLELGRQIYERQCESKYQYQ